MIFAMIFMPLTLLLFLFEKSINNFFITYVYENDLELYLNYKEERDLKTFQEKRYISSSKILFFIIFFPILKFNIYYLLIIAALTIYAYKKPYIKIRREYKESLALVRYQFPIWLRQIQILLHNNNVINSLILSKDFAPDIIKDDLDEMIIQLNKSPNNVAAFVSFMDQFNISEINRAMKLLYRCYIVDKNESSKQLNRLIATTTKWIRQERLERQKDNLSFYEWVGIIPLLGVTIMFLVMMASLLANIFGRGGI